MKPIVIVLLFTTLAYSQEKNVSNRLEIEADPLAYLLSGHSLHVAYTLSAFRFSLGTFGIKQPDFFLDHDAFSVRTFGFDAKIDYLFNRVKGFFVGAQTTYSRDRIGLKIDLERQHLWGPSVGLRTGYRFMFGREIKNFSGFYLIPWLMVGYAPNPQSIIIGDQTYRQPRWFPFPSIHLGWRF
jgi:hypothetical protein